MRTIIISLLFTIFTFDTSLANDTDKQISKLSAFIKKNKVGEQDYWLQMDTAYGWLNVALVMGYWDDYTACTELIDGLEATQFINKRDYRCYPAN